jgi:hypothetical protein
MTTQRQKGADAKQKSATKSEPYRLREWKQSTGESAGRLFTCARPGRSKGSQKAIPETVVDEWVRGLPFSEKQTAIVSLLGQKLDGTNEFKFYSFRSEVDQSLERRNHPTFQQWLDERYGVGRYRVFEYPTTDTKPIAGATLRDVVSRIQSLAREPYTTVLMDSGGCVRVECVCMAMRFREVPTDGRPPGIMAPV